MDSIYVEKSGQGPALVLLHGWGLHGGIWQTLLPKLQDSFSVYNLDLPGFGHSRLNDSVEYNLDYLVGSVARFLETLEQPCFLIGWSLGGLVATALALKHPNLVSKLITVASSPRFVADDDWPHAMQAEVLNAFIASLSLDYQVTLQRFLMVQTMGSLTQKSDIKQLKAEVLSRGEPDIKALQGGLAILHAINLIDQLPDLKPPLLRLYGRLDSLVPQKVAFDVGRLLPQSQAKIYQRAAHAPFLSVPDEFVKDVKFFLMEDSHEST